MGITFGFCEKQVKYLHGSFILFGASWLFLLSLAFSLVIVYSCAESAADTVNSC